VNPWHEVQVDEDAVGQSFPAIIEIPSGSRNKYELDKETGLLRLDRVLHGAIHYPANYGFIPQTLSEDGDPLDVLVLCLEPVHPLTVMDARAVGLMCMKDEKGIDDKILAVSLHDVAFSSFSHYREIPPYALEEIRKFFEEYKSLEDKEVLVKDMEGPEEAVAAIRKSLHRYRDHFGDQGAR
jgi:inorganic pyrophosphatase